MTVDTFTESLRVLCVALAAGFILLVAECIRHWRWQRRRAQPFDWAREIPSLAPELDDHIHVRVIHLDNRWR